MRLEAFGELKHQMIFCGIERATSRIAAQGLNQLGYSAHRLQSIPEPFRDEAGTEPPPRDPSDTACANYSWGRTIVRQRHRSSWPRGKVDGFYLQRAIRGKDRYIDDLVERRRRVTLPQMIRHEHFSKVHETDALQRSSGGNIGNYVYHHSLGLVITLSL
jgi:hypothetical protein